MKSLLFIFVMIFTTSAASVEIYSLVRTTADSLNVRSSPAGKIIYSLPKGSLASVMKTEGEWSKLLFLVGERHTGLTKEGWVSAKYLQAYQ
ncbi:MAG: SH3 domain-containing protein [Gammaproteobacteria bacterium]|nr:SH3 domain-containing protein [Gammaproteobacteria bacterium]